jgi:hypothetical protein
MSDLNSTIDWKHGTDVVQPPSGLGESFILAKLKGQPSCLCRDFCAVFGSLWVTVMNEKCGHVGGYVACPLDVGRELGEKFVHELNHDIPRMIAAMIEGPPKINTLTRAARAARGVRSLVNVHTSAIPNSVHNNQTT